MIRTPWFWLALLPACIQSPSAIAQVSQLAAPSDNELHSAYCVSLLKSEITFVHDALAQAEASVKSTTTPSSPDVEKYATKMRAEMRENVAKLETARNRLQSYLLPKMMTLDPAALTLAMRRGEADW